MTEVRCPKTIVLLCKRKFIAILRSDVALAYGRKIGTEEPAQEKVEKNSISPFERAPRLMRGCLPARPLRIGSTPCVTAPGITRCLKTANAMRDTISFRPSGYRAATLRCHIQKADQFEKPGASARTVGTVSDASAGSNAGFD